MRESNRSFFKIIRTLAIKNISTTSLVSREFSRQAVGYWIQNVLAGVAPLPSLSEIFCLDRVNSFRARELSGQRLDYFVSDCGSDQVTNIVFQVPHCVRT